MALPTVAFAEMANGAGESGESPNPLSDCFDFGGTPPTTDLQAAQAALLAKDWRTSEIASLGGGPWRWRGNPWTEGSMWRTWYNHILPPNNPCWKGTGGGSVTADFWDLVSPASSLHPGGVNVCMCDGSVRYVAENVDPIVWVAAGTPDGGEIFELP